MGKVSPRDKERVSNYRDQCWRGDRAHSGYPPDIYELLIFREISERRTIDSINLSDWIAADPKRGSIDTVDDLHRWTPGDGDMIALQGELDRARILLAGYSPESNA